MKADCCREVEGMSSDPQPSAGAAISDDRKHTAADLISHETDAHASCDAAMNCCVVLPGGPGSSTGLLTPDALNFLRYRTAASGFAALQVVPAPDYWTMAAPYAGLPPASTEPCLLNCTLLL